MINSFSNQYTLYFHKLITINIFKQWTGIILIEIPHLVLQNQLHIDFYA